MQNKFRDMDREYQRSIRHSGKEIPLEDVSDQALEKAAAAAHRDAQREEISQEQQQAVASAIDNLPALRRFIVGQRFWFTQTFQQIGDAIGRSAEAARKLNDRALYDLSGLLSMTFDR